MGGEMRAPLKMEDADMLGSMLRETGGVVARGHNTPKAAVVERKLRFPRILHIFYTRGRARVDIRVFVFFEAPPLFTLFQTPTPLTNTLPTPTSTHTRDFVSSARPASKRQ